MYPRRPARRQELQLLAVAMFLGCIGWSSAFSASLRGPVSIALANGGSHVVVAFRKMGVRRIERIDAGVLEPLPGRGGRLRRCGGLSVHPAPCPAHQTQEPHRDFLRTTLEQIVDGGTVISLGNVTCLADKHELTHLEEAADMGTDVGRIWVFLSRTAGDSDYGQSSQGKPRTPASGDCPQTAFP